MLARMNFASHARRQPEIQSRGGGAAVMRASPDALLSYVLESLTTPPLDSPSTEELSNYLRATGPWTAQHGTDAGEGCGPRPSRGRNRGVPVRMKVTRRQFVKGGVAAFTVTFAAPEFLSDLARAQGARARNLVVLYLGGGNDSLSMLDPVQRSLLLQPPADALPCRPATCCRSGPTRSSVALGLHPRLTGLKQIFDQGRLALIQRTGYPNQSRSHFQGTDIWATANPANPSGLGWVGRYLDSLPSPLDPLVGWNTTRDLPHVLQSSHVAVPAIPNPQPYAFSSPNTRPGGSRGRAQRRDTDQLARARRSARAGVRVRQRASRHGARSTASPPSRTYTAP